MAGLRVNRNNAKIYINVGRAMERSKNFTSALSSFQQAALYVPYVSFVSCVTAIIVYRVP